MGPRVPPLLAGLALAFGALVLVTGWIGPWELHHDELYYWAGSRRLGLGYVDHPPLAPWLLAGWTALLGDGRLAFGAMPALCFAATVLLAGRMARRLGAGSYGQALAGLCVGFVPFHLVLFSFYSVNAQEVLLWTAASLLVLELVRTGDERLWLGIGTVIGIGLLNKHTTALFAAGLGVGVLATDLRGQLRGRWPWLGAALALGLASPNLVWNAWHGWPSLAFYRSRPEVDLPTSVLEALELQVWGANPANLLVWVPGVLFLLLAGRGRWRPLGIAFLVLFVVVLASGQRRGDRIAGVYPVALAAGAAFWERWTAGGRRGVRVALVVVVLLFGALVLPATLPVLSPEATGRYMQAIGQKPEIEKADLEAAIPIYLTGRLDWERFAGEVADAWEALPADVRGRAAVLAPHWVEASVVEYYGRERGVAPVLAPHNAWWFWRHEAAGRDVVLAVAIPAAALSPWFADVRQVGFFRCRYCTAFRSDAPILLATGPVRPLEELLTEWRHFGILNAPALRRRGRQRLPFLRQPIESARVSSRD